MVNLIDWLLDLFRDPAQAAHARRSEARRNALRVRLGRRELPV